MRRSFLDCIDRALVYAESAFDAFLCIDDGHIIDDDRALRANIFACTAGGAFRFVNGYHLDNLGRQIHELV